MIKAIIVEDEPKAADLLHEMINEIEPMIHIVARCGDLPEAVKSIKTHKPDLVFLDVELPVYSGLQLLDFFNADEINFNIIFTTASNEHALRAFEMSAVDYVLKPIQYEKLKTAIQKYQFNKQTKTEFLYTTLKDNYFKTGIPKIVVPVTNGYEIIKLEDILYFQAEGSYVNIHLADKSSLLVSRNLKYFEDILKDETHFIRIHRSKLVNINYAIRIVRNDGVFLVMENCPELPVAADKVDILLRFFNFNKKG